MFTAEKIIESLKYINQKGEGQPETFQFLVSEPVYQVYETILSSEPDFKPLSSFHILQRARELSIEVRRDPTGRVVGHQVRNFGRRHTTKILPPPSNGRNFLGPKDQKGDQ